MKFNYYRLASLKNGKGLYKGTAAVSGGTSPYTWKASGIPAGLALTQNTKGTKVYIKGKPTKAKTYNLKLTATDSKNVTSTKTFTITIAKKSSSASKSTSANQIQLIQPVTFNESINQTTVTTSLSIFEDDILLKGEGKDEDLIQVKADKVLRFIIGEWPTEINSDEIEIYVDDKKVDGITISDDGKFELPVELVHDDFKVKARAGEFETVELFINAVI